MKNPKNPLPVSKSLPPHILLGASGEDTACNILKNYGYEILERNWRRGHLELDIICSKEGQIIFVEVKTRRSRNHGGPVGAITLAKIKNISLAAQIWLQENCCWEKQCRFDVICLISKDNEYYMEYFPNAFEAVYPVGCGNASW